MEKYKFELTAEEICLIRNALIIAKMNEEEFFGNRTYNRVKDYERLMKLFEEKRKEIFG